MVSPSRFSFTGASTRRLPIGELIGYHAAADPDAVLLVVDGQHVARADFDARSNRRARMLAARGVGQDDLVTIALPNGLEFYETAFAVWKLGATPGPIATSLSDVELRAILDVARPRLVVGVDPARAPGHAVLPSCPVVPPEFAADWLPAAVPRYWKAMTSGGSTGRPKLIVDHMPGEWDPAEGGLAQQPGERVLNPGPLYHNGPFLATVLAMFSGGTIFELGRFDPVEVLAAIERHRISWLLLVPTMMHRIARLPLEQRTAFDLSSLKTVLHTASACPAWLKAVWIDWLGPDVMLEVYTGTERQAAATITGREALTHPGSVGRLQPGAALRILDADGDDVARGEIGEIFLRPDSGRGSTYHYIGAAPRTHGEWESLGDLGRVDVDGYIYLSDRRVDLIIRGGANIYPAEVEGAIDAHPAVASSLVIGLPDDDLGQIVHAIVERSASSDVSEAALREFLSSRLSWYKIPKTIEFVDAALRDAAGKARRSALVERRIAASEEDKA